MTTNHGYRVEYLNDRTARMVFNDNTTPDRIVEARHPSQLQGALRTAGRQHHFSFDPLGCIEEIFTTEILGEDY